ncbi:hypothetical protein DM02DRAFT_617342 [Periconia macrospinosa]|uniref:Uncharacterized protein n=1 Tax=Periconia macrospinosa TaxID=97972 RepID=A0A2V1DE12_9PLEO|nr:hypothetical protein DM02DRAFT_617342 [Periconia macrospinosa]
MNRRFFVTEKGYFGLGPPDIQEADSVCILLGGSTPYILRPRHAHSLGARSLGAGYDFVGDAYVHGIMQGEAVAEHIQSDGSIQTQFIRIW